MGKRAGRQRKQAKAYLRSPFEIALPKLLASDQGRIVAALQSCLADFTKAIREQKAQRSKAWAQQRAHAKEGAKETATKKLSRSQRRREVQRRRQQRRKQQQAAGKRQGEEGKKGEQEQQREEGEERQKGSAPTPQGGSLSHTASATQQAKEATHSSAANQGQPQHQQRGLQTAAAATATDVPSTTTPGGPVEASGPQNSAAKPKAVLSDETLAFYRQRFVTGINAATRALEKEEAEAVLLWQNVQPPMLVQHIPCMCHRKGVPLIPLDKPAAARVSAIFKLPRVSVVALCTVPRTTTGTPLSPQKLQQLHSLVRLCKTTAQPLDVPFITAPHKAQTVSGSADRAEGNLEANEQDARTSIAQAEGKADGEEQLQKKAKAEDAAAAGMRYVDMKLEVVEVTPKQKVNGRRVLSNQNRGKEKPAAQTEEGKEAKEAKQTDEGKAAKEPKQTEEGKAAKEPKQTEEGKEAKEAKQTEEGKAAKEAKQTEEGKEAKEQKQSKHSKRMAASTPPQTTKRPKQAPS